MALIMDFIEILKAIVQGIVQGITEWLPISSTGHILLLDAIWPMNVSPDFFNVFKVVIQLGSIMAVVVLYFHKLNPFSPKKSQKEKGDTFRLWGKVLIASIPAGVVGMALNDLIDSIPWSSPPPSFYMGWPLSGWNPGKSSPKSAAFRRCLINRRLASVFFKCWP